MSNLEKEVKEIVEGYVKDGTYESTDAFMVDLNTGGCAGGMIGELFWYEQTVKFFHKHKTEINELLVDWLESTGTGNPASLFNNWDSSDVLVLEQNNQNILAWFAFEETARRLFGGD